MSGTDIDPTATMKDADNVEIITHGTCGTCDTRLVEGVQASEDTHFVACNSCAGLVKVVTDADQERRKRDARMSISTDTWHGDIDETDLGDDSDDDEATEADA